MFKHLLVPLDGSHLAEAVLPFVYEISRRFRSEITLLHIIEKDAPDTIHGNNHLQKPADAEQYLVNLKLTITHDVPSLTPGQVYTHVHSEEQSNLAQSIVGHCDEIMPDLILLTHHGETGLRDRTVGSVAQQVIGAGERPVLLIHPNPANETHKHFHQILATLDLVHDPASILKPLEEIMAAFSSKAILLSVVGNIWQHVR